MKDESDAQRRAIREQVAAVMRKAQAILGGRAQLAEHLGVEPHMVGEWLACRSDAPNDVLDAAVELVVELDPQATRKGAGTH